jgi:disulfide bond formation protein DsbB
MNYVPALITLMAAGTVALNIALVLCLLSLLNTSWLGQVVKFLRGNGRLIIFLLSLGSVAGSLFLQYAGAISPCLLCWWQRIFMYPIVIISAIAVVKDTDVSEIADYVLTLSIFGACVALYQHLLQMLPAGSLIPCDASGDCAVRSVFEFNFVTIPWMALSVFAVLIFITLLARKKA